MLVPFAAADGSCQLLYLLWQRLPVLSDATVVHMLSCMTAVEQQQRGWRGDALVMTLNARDLPGRLARVYHR